MILAVFLIAKTITAAISQSIFNIYLFIGHFVQFFLGWIKIIPLVVSLPLNWRDFIVIYWRQLIFIILNDVHTLNLLLIVLVLVF